MRTVTLICAMLFSMAAAAQSWPQKPVKFIVPFAPGGATDIAARMLGEKLSQLWGQSVVIENRAGAGGALGAAEAARAAPDGYTLFFPSGSVMTANQFVYGKLNYDPERDFVPVTNVVTGPQGLVVPANSPHKTVKELIDFENAGWFGIVAPTGTPRVIVEKVYVDTRKSLESTEMKARLYAQGLTPVGNTPAEFAAAMKTESDLWAKVVRERKIHVQ